MQLLLNVDKMIIFEIALSVFLLSGSVLVM